MTTRRRYSMDATRDNKRISPNASNPASSSNASTSPKKGKGRGQPLRRGDACLMCRAKKLKCSATKPVCDQCIKRNDRCVYDGIRPASRVEKLEKQLAQLEEEELQKALAARRHSTNSMSEKLTKMGFGSMSLPNQSSSMIGGPSHVQGSSSVFQFQPPPSMGSSAAEASTSALSMSASPQGDSRPSTMPNLGFSAVDDWSWSNTPTATGYPGPGSTATSSTSLPIAQPTAVHAMDLNHPWSMMDPSSSTNVSNWTNSLPDNTSGMNVGSSGSNFDPNALDVVMLDSLNDPSLGGFAFNDFQTSLGLAGVVPSSTPVSGSGISSSGISPRINSVSAPPQPFFIPQVNTNAPNKGLRSQQMFPTPTSSTAEKSYTHLRQGVYSPSATGLVIGENDISPSAKSYLLDLFFAPPRERFGSEPFTQAQFQAKLSQQSPKCPHPCLVFAMCTTAASSSYIPAVRALADPLYSIASRKLEESITLEDRLLDAIRAAKILSKWLYSVARPLEGHQMGWRSVSLALACQLHRIPSGVYMPESEAFREHPWPLLGPPKDQWELGERIHAFWAIWGNDRGACVMVPWPSGLRDEVITTPFPRAPQRYLDGSISQLPDVRLHHLYTDPTKIQTLDIPYVHLIFAFHLLIRAKNLRHVFPESSPTYRQLAISQEQRPQQNPGQHHLAMTYSARRDHPLAYADIMEGMKNLQMCLAEKCKIHYTSATPWSDPNTPLTHVALLSARLQLHEIDGTPYERETAISTSREIAGIIRLWLHQIRSSESFDRSTGSGEDPLDPTKISSDRMKNGIGGLYILNPWFWTAHTLSKGERILRGLDRNQEADQLKDDFDMIMAGLKSLGVVYHQGEDSAIVPVREMS